MKKSRLVRIVLILVVAGSVYWQRSKGPIEKAETAPGSGGAAVLKKDPLGGNAASAKVNGYDKFVGAKLINDDGNDGDSFYVDLNGRKVQLRLYFVDAPEKYLSDRYENQRRRVAEQASEMGGVSPEQIVEVGKAAKLFMERELKGKPFTVYTYWEEVYDGDRYYGFVELADGSYLGTKLVENGLARIHTKGPGSKENPVPTPDGKKFFDHRDMLENLERKAQKADRGAWGL
ncbi:MAG: thermonuclease family protein [Verrucomicrobiales bacterium]|jgi:endonuclease YncB( thermonuclease family)|nr:thermonuclease family protein [Verrucomicrobiales bacterium]